INLSTVNGKVNLVIPSDSSATVKADSLNGNISNDFGLPVRKGRYVGRDLYGRIGNGDVNIHLSSVNGALAIGHKNDGKSLSPAVDLLPQKKDGDDDWDSGNTAVADTAKMNKDIAKAVKASEKAVAKASVDVNVQVQKMQPEIAKITTESIARATDAIEQSTQIINSADYKE